MGKVKLMLGIILLIVGAGVLPTGYVLHNNIEAQLDAAIPQTLLSIRDQFLPEAEKMIKFEAIAPAMLGIRDSFTPEIPYLLNGSITVITINQTIYELSKQPLMDYSIAMNLFFNDPVWSITTGGAFPINSISEVMGQSLGFTALAQNRTLFGYGNFAGLLMDLELGSGIFTYLQRFQNAIGDTTKQNNLINAYNATWEQISNVSAYISSYMFPLVPSLGSLPFVADDSTAATYFSMQWANATLENEGIILPIRSGVEAWEIGVTHDNGTTTHRPSNFTLPLITALWNELDPYSPFNYDDGGFYLWYASISNSTIATDIQDHFSMDPSDYALFLSYLFDDEFRDRVIVPLVEYSEGTRFENVVLEAFYSQWSTGALIPEGISSLGPEYAILEGFEVVLPPTDFTLGSRSANLWDPNNTLSLISASGISDWLLLSRLDEDDEIGETIQFAQILEEYNMAESRVEVLAAWVLRFRTEILPVLALQEGMFFMHPTEFANMLSVGGFIVGGFLAFLGVILIFSYRKR